MPDKFRQGPGLLLEPLRAVGEVIRLCVHHNGDRGSLYAGSDVAGHVLFDGHLGLELGIEGQVSDAEAALTQDAANDIAVIEHRPGPQGHRELFRVLRQVEAAVWAEALRTLPLGEAVVAEIIR